MNSKISLLISFAVGAAAGVVETSIYLKKKYEKAMDEYRRDMEEYYGKADEYMRRSKPAEEEVASENVRPSNEKERAEMKEKLKMNREKKDPIAYDKMYHSTFERDNYSLYPTDPAEAEYPREEDKEEPPSAEFLEHLDDLERKPEIISAEDAAGIPTGKVNTIELNFYDDGIFVDENDLEVDYPMELIGIEIYDRFIDREFNGEEIVIVMNYSHQTLYEVGIAGCPWT